MAMDFDTFIERRNTWSLKWDYNDKIFGQKDILPMWVADMDFPSPEAVIEAITKRAEHGVFGYTRIPDSYTGAVVDWMKKRNNWNIKGEWLAHSPGVVTAINIAILAFTDPGDKILIQTPVYHPFYSCVKENKRQLVLNPLKLENEYYTMDFDDLDRKLGGDVRMMILCSPHNPVGRVWRKEELARVCELCIKHNVLLVSDEIHSDMIYKGYIHTPVASISEEIAQNSITCIAPSKTFNVAGLAASLAVIPNKELRSRFESMLHSTGAGVTNIFGITAAEAAYRHGEEWLEGLMGYLQGNLNMLLEYFTERISKINVVKPEGTYLAWLDCRELGMEPKALKEFFITQARVGMNDGAMFGDDGAGFQRLNFACPRSLLKEGLQRIENAVKGM